MSEAERDHRLPTVQALRGLAASLVVFHHFARLYQEGRPSPSWINASGLGDLGKCGVDIFFVISGFIMVYTTKRKVGARDALIFITRRSLRIYPLYWIWTTLLLVLWVGGVVLRRDHYSVSYLVGSYLLIPSMNGLNYQPLIRQGWTLSFEMLFYLVFSCGILLKLRFGKLLFAAVAFSVLALLSNLLAPDNGIRYLLGDPIIAEFLYGMLAAEVLSRLPALSNARMVKVIPIALMCVGGILLLCTVKLHDASQMRFVFYGIPALCLVAGAIMPGAISVPRILVYLGNCSYSIYITHEFFSWAYDSALKHFSVLHRVPADIGILLAGAMTIALSSFTYSLVEQPLTRLLAFKTTPSPVSNLDVMYAVNTGEPS
jgi:exopolysaccharide production protein ExoZ